MGHSIRVGGGVGVGRIVGGLSFQVLFTRAGWRVRRYDRIGNGVA